VTERNVTITITGLDKLREKLEKLKESPAIRQALANRDVLSVEPIDLSPEEQEALRNVGEVIRVAALSMANAFAPVVRAWVEAAAEAERTLANFSHELAERFSEQYEIIRPQIQELVDLACDPAFQRKMRSYRRYCRMYENGPKRRRPKSRRRH